MSYLKLDGGENIIGLESEPRIDVPSLATQEPEQALHALTSRTTAAAATSTTKTKEQRTPEGEI